MGTIQSEALMKGSPLISSQSGPLKGAEGVFIVDSNTESSIFNMEFFDRHRSNLNNALLNNDQYVSDIVSERHLRGRQMQH